MRLGFHDSMSYLWTRRALYSVNNPVVAPASPKLSKELDLSQQLTRENSKETFNYEDDMNTSYTSSSSSMSDADDSKLHEDSQIFVEQAYLDEEKNLSPCFRRKTHDEARLSYINKLVNMKVMNLKPKKKTQNISVFDWDDTIFCTSFFGNASLNKIPCEHKATLCNLDTTASSFLSMAAKAGDVVIITNSDEGWVQHSARVILPRTYQVIMRKNIKVISARSRYENMYPNNTYRWKEEAFLSLRRKYDEEVMTNLVVVGDSEIEIEAAKKLGKEFKQSLVKTVKLQECPKPEELIRQHKILIRLFDDIFLGCRSMTVKLGRNCERSLLQ